VATIEELLSALYVGAGTFISYNTLEVFAEKDDGVTIRLLSTQPSPEQFTILHDLFLNLQKDSRWLLSLIQNSPELLSTPLTGRVTRASVIQHLRKKRWSRSKIAKTIQEVESFIAEMESV
jgi:hypothetical protein